MKVAQRRRQREREARRRAILQAALRLFVRQGYEHTSIEQIAEEAELSKGLVYFYFESKDQILATLIEETYEELHRLLQERLSPLTEPVEKLRVFIETEIAFYGERQDLFRLIASLLGGYTLQEIREAYQTAFRRAHEKETAILKVILQENLEAGTLRVPHPDLVAIFIGGALHGLLTLRPRDRDPREMLAPFQTLLFQGILKQEARQ